MIETAAKRLLARVRDFLDGPNAKVARRIIDEITTARETLIDPGKRAAYDSTLNQATNSRDEHPWDVANAAPSPAPSPGRRQNETNFLENEAHSDADRFPSYRSVARRRPEKSASGALLIGGGILAAGVIAVVIWFAARGSGPSEESKKHEVVEQPAKKVTPPVHEANPKKKAPDAKKDPRFEVPPPAKMEFKEATTWAGHAGAPKVLAVSPDGKQLLSTADDLAVYAWTAEREKPYRRLTLKSPPAVGVGYLPGGKRAVAADGGTISVFDLADNHVRYELKTESGGFTGFAVAKDGVHLLTCSNDGRLRWWNIAEDKPEWTTEASAGEGALDCVALAADDTVAVAGGHDGKVSCWDVTTGKLRKKWPAHKGAVTAVALTPDGGRVISVGEDSLGKVWDRETGNLLFTLKGHAGAVNSVCCSADGSMILTAGIDMTLRAWEAATGDPLRWASKAQAKIYSLALDPHDRFAVIGLSDRNIQLVFLPKVRPESLPRAEQVQAPKTPLPMPPTAAIEAAAKSVREKYKSDFEQTSSDDRLVLADKLLTRARLAPLEPALRWALFQQASELAAQAGLPDSAIKAVDARAPWFRADNLADKVAALRRAAQAPADKSTAALAAALAAELVRQDRADLVAEMLEDRDRLLTPADAAKLAEKLEAAERRRKEIAGRRNAVQKAAKDLQTMPGDGAANQVYGQHLCFERGEWEEGLPRLARAADASLASLARRDQAALKDEKSHLDVAKAWHAYAAKAEESARVAIWLRSKFWFEKVKSNKGTSLADKLAADAKMNEIDKLVAAAKAAPGGVAGPVLRHCFNSIRSAAALDSQWAVEGSDGFHPDGVLLKTDASLTSRFQILDGARLEFSFVPDGREIKVELNGEDAKFKPAAGDEPVSLTVERRGNEIQFALKTREGAVQDEKSAPLPPAKQAPKAMTFSVAGAAAASGLRLTSVVVDGPVTPAE